MVSHSKGYVWSVMMDGSRYGGRRMWSHRTRSQEAERGDRLCIDCILLFFLLAYAVYEFPMNFTYIYIMHFRHILLCPITPFWTLLSPT